MIKLDHLEKMPVAITFKRINGELFEFPFRMIISGSSQCGKTTFAERILRENVFGRKPEFILYCHPDLCGGTPVNWEDTLDIPITYHTGVPTLAALQQLNSNTVVVLDDLYEECITSRGVDQLFRVISGKKNISVIAMTQRYFAQGRFGMNIRNNCTSTVIMRNADERINKKLGNLFNCKKDFEIALKEFQDKQFPYIMINHTRCSLVTGCRIYTKVFGKCKFVIMNGENLALMPKRIFRKHFKVIARNQAKVKNVIGDFNDSYDENFTDCSDEPMPKRRKIRDTDTSQEITSEDEPPDKESEFTPETTENNKNQIEQNRLLLEELSKTKSTEMVDASTQTEENDGDESNTEDEYTYDSYTSDSN